MHYYNISAMTSASFATSERLTGFFLIEWDGKDLTGKKRVKNRNQIPTDKHLTLIYMGGGGKFASQAVFLLQLKNGWG